MKIEIAIPCRNEDLTITKVIKDFSKEIPGAEIVVYDNDSSDRTIELAKKAGAKVKRVNRKGKGHVVQSIFESTSAEIIVIVDGDDTYEAKDVHSLIQPIISEEADMTIGTRLHSNPAEFRRMHRFGNRLMTWVLNTMFQSNYCDILSGYRAFSRRFIESIPLISTGFEVETELMIQVLENDITVKEIPIRFRNRPSGSQSKLNSFKDGYRIMLMMISLLRDHRPLLMFSIVGIIFFVLGTISWLFGFIYSSNIPRLSVLRNGGVVIIVFSVGLFLVGLILNTINTRMRELSSLIRRKRL
jgi:glycosyltransferase involved in cell wall biosynthesis